MAIELSNIPENFGAGGRGLQGTDHGVPSLDVLLREHKAALEVLNWSTAYALHVNKGGSASNGGTNPSDAFDTIGAAIAKANSLTPTVDNRIAIYIDDAGSYDEDLTIQEWVGIIGNASLIDGQHVIADNALLRSFRLVNSGTGRTVTKAAGTGLATVDCPRMVLTNGADGVLCQAGALNYYGNSMEVEDGFAIGTVSTGDVHACVSQIHISGTGIGIGIASSGGLDFVGDTIRDEGAGTGIFVSSTGNVHAFVNHIECSTVYNVSANAELALIVGRLVGTRTGAGLIQVTQAGNVSRVTQTIGHADLTQASNGVAQSINLGRVLPADAFILGRTIRDVTPFSGGGVTAVGMDIGGTDADAIVAGEDVLGGGSGDRQGTSGANPNGKFGGQQIAARFTPDASHNLDQLTAGSVTIDVLFGLVV